MKRRTYLLGLCLLAGACVDALAKQPLGNADFAAGASLSSADYAQGVAPPPPAATAPTGTAPPIGPTLPGTAGTGALPPPAASVGGAAAPPPPAAGPAGRAATGLAGRSAAAAGSGVAPPLAGAGVPAAGGPAVPPTGGGKLSVTFKTVAVGGRYAPRNVGAVWIETASGMFVKTLERWAGIRVVHLTRWTMASGGWGSRFGGGGNAADMMDAVSRATLRSHEMHQLMWDMQDASGKPVPDGKYNLMIEVADDNFSASTASSVAFDKGPSPATVMAPDKAPYSGLSINYQP